MKTKFVNISGVKVLTRENLKSIQGSSYVFNGDNSDFLDKLALCKCDCYGNLTGPRYCSNYVNCPIDLESCVDLPDFMK